MAWGSPLRGSGNYVYANYIGTAQNSAAGIGNAGAGVYVGGAYAFLNRIGEWGGAGNVISGNDVGIELGWFRSDPDHHLQQ